MNATTLPASSERPVGPLSVGLTEFERLRGVVRREGACALPGVSIKPETFLPAVWRAVERGYVAVDDATFVQAGRRDGFTLGDGRSIGKALDKFSIDRETWPQLAADRAAWRETLRSGLAPPAFRPTLSPRVARTKPVRSCVAASTAKIEASLREERSAAD